MSEISKESLAAACAEKVRQLEFSVQQSAFDSVRQELETELAIARVALLALRERAEPVAWRHDDGPFASGALTRSKSVAESWIGNGWKVTPLYTAPPAPVVYQISELEKVLAWIEKLPIPTYGATTNYRRLKSVLDACRRTMFEPVSSSYKLPDGWIPCSERLPEVGDEIFYCCEDDGIRDCGIVSSSNFTGRGDAELFVHAEGYDLRFGADITHWMPLPEAPATN
ncbi:DUF551 domain-containing protein [Cronobacter sakazakii]|uniref:DUF551 domain-containing protein n=1 Tax=Cronobacter sakazakii TaxID=28141 RepID=UPI0028956587|nr:DUF551 domain-containing protein [Cronobacter sakazakii]ELY4201861.1 DUF551 domain-containing protein [Cronobacter sakazakii]MDT3632760.1 DUF551 domain-containing protein [Cronobacter sakazakii]